jgi:ankyrin repeat protein
VVVLTLAYGGFCGEVHDAARDGDLGVVKELITANPALVFSKDNFGGTPLLWAAMRGHKDIVELLLANKADVDAKANDDTTSLESAAVFGHKDVVELLLANKADVNAKNNLGTTPLHAAADKGYVDIAKVLLANKADVNAKDNIGLTPLHYAAGYGHKDVVELLLANKADVNAQDKQGATPLRLAVFKGQNGVAEFLRKYIGHEQALADGRTTDATMKGGKIGSPPKNWPEFSTELTGLHEVRVRNPNDFNVRVGLRSDGMGKDFIVSPRGTESVNVPNGRYDIYFNYSADPGGLYQGDSFTLENNGVEITITKVVNGNYGIRKVNK